MALRASPFHMTLGMVFTVATGLLAPLTALVLARLLGGVALGGTGTGIVWVGGLVALASVSAAAPPMLEYSKGELGRRLVADSQQRFFGAVNEIPDLASFEDPKFRDELRLAQQGSETAPLTVTDSLTAIAQSLITLSTFGFFLIVHEPAASLLLLCCLGPAALLNLRDSRQQVELMWATTPAERRRYFYSSLLSDLQALKEIRIFGLSTFFRSRMSAPRFPSLRSARAP